ncbi:MAG TPA: hypothetical protein VKA94_11635, partial [Hyphomicrobiales bacterium]|nr:hypothetical protein [Hyphomicrobiales bacterium]
GSPRPANAMAGRPGRRPAIALHPRCQWPEGKTVSTFAKRSLLRRSVPWLALIAIAAFFQARTRRHPVLSPSDLSPHMRKDIGLIDLKHRPSTRVDVSARSACLRHIR